jgi:hypothetical protein
VPTLGDKETHRSNASARGVRAGGRLAGPALPSPAGATLAQGYRRPAGGTMVGTSATANVSCAHTLGSSPKKTRYKPHALARAKLLY